MRTALTSITAAAFTLLLAACERDQPVQPAPVPPPQTGVQASAATPTPPPATTATPARAANPTTAAPPAAGTTEGNLTAHQEAVIDSHGSDGEATTDDDGTDARGVTRSHIEADTVAAEQIEGVEDNDRNRAEAHSTDNEGVDPVRGPVDDDRNDGRR